MPLSKLPKVQAYIAKVCKEHNKNFMVVTQMLDSMIRNPYPTRAEVNDIYHAVHQGANALMLTGETAHGRYPVEEMCIRDSSTHYTLRSTSLIQRNMR